jgi:small subunit ribosomal protein S1
MPVQGVITGVNKGGVDVQIAGMRAFCPVSQLDLRFVENPESYVGLQYEFRITKLSESRGRADIVVSRKALLEEAASIEAESTRAILQEGALLDGTVTSLKPFGAFVDVGGIEGMIHVSELGHARVDKPEDVLAVGQRVKVFVLKVEKTGDPKRPEKVALSLKALENDPWNDLIARFGEGSRVTGTVVRNQPFGSFVELAPGVEGLVHISELGAGRRINHPREVVSEGQKVEVTVLSIDPTKRRIALSMDPEKVPVAPEDRPVAPEAPRSLGTLADLFKQGR